jgi:hypothetical protein
MGHMGLSHMGLNTYSNTKNDFPVLLVLLPVLRYSKVLILIFIIQQGFDAQTWKIYSRMGVYFI